MRRSGLWPVFGLATVLLASCGGNTSVPEQQVLPAVATPAGQEGVLLSDEGRRLPVVGKVDGIDQSQLEPGVVTSIQKDAEGLSVEVDRDAVVRRIEADLSRSTITQLAAGQSATLALDARTEYFELDNGEGGNKVTMGASEFPDGVLDQPILFIKSNPVDNPNRTPFMAFRNLGRNFFADQTIMRLDPDGTLTQVLTISDRPMQDLELSYDGKKLLLAMREFGGSDMELFEVNIDGTNLTQLTFNDYDDGEPTYLPSGDILFTSERYGIGDFYDAGTQVPHMHILDRFTGEERQIHISSNGAFNPIVSHTGEILFISWDTRINIAGPRYNRFVVWKMLPDGRFAFPVFGSHIVRDSIDCFVDLSETYDHQMLLTHTNFNLPTGGRAHHENYGAGAIVKADPAGNPDFPSYSYLTEKGMVDAGDWNTYGRYKFPVGLPDGRILVSYAPGAVWNESEGDQPDFGIYIMDEDGSNLTAICDAEGITEFGAIPLMPRTIPPVIPDETKNAEDWGEFACENIFDRGGDQRQGNVLPEDGPWTLRVKQVRRVDGLPNGDPGDFSFGNHNFPLMGESNLIGEYPVAPDGSFRIRIPANTPITWELVDGTGRVAVRERMFNSVQPGEVHTCAGCHGRIDIQNNIDLGRQAFKPTGPGFHDLRGLFEDFYGTVIDNTPEE
ncbi:MAG: hypothetical protein H7A35_08485 [Planctomycetales bacterium]|nr:hypothetical protein [bacterium]UNM06921.1 MAG: hypothetical protein H7A35_08485 [Planctomycetales bacterium]